MLCVPLIFNCNINSTRSLKRQKNNPAECDMCGAFLVITNEVSVTSFCSNVIERYVPGLLSREHGNIQRCFADLAIKRQE